MKTERKTKKIYRWWVRTPLPLVLVLLFITLPMLFADLPPVFFWGRHYGGVNNDRGHDVEQTADGGYIAVGYTGSFGAGLDDVYLIKTDAFGDTLWTKTYGGLLDDYGYAVEQTSDLGYIITGTTNSFGGFNEVYLIKTDTDGNVEWTKIYGGPSDDYAFDVQQTADLGYIIAGYTVSFGAGMSDVYLLRTDANGDTLWTKTFGGADLDVGISVDVTSDQGYIITGSTNSFGAGNSDVYLLRTDANGDTLWTKTFGGTYDDVGNSVLQTTDFGFAVAGYTYSTTGGEDSDVYLLTTDSNGDINWEETYGDSGQHECGYSVDETDDEGFIVGGYINATGGEDGDLYLLRADSSGDSLWTEFSEVPYTIRIYAIIQTDDLGYVVCGYIDNPAFVSGENVYIAKYRRQTVGIEDEVSSANRFSIFQVGSNPFKDRAVIGYELLHTNIVNITVYNHLGQTVKTLVLNRSQETGTHTVVWNGTDDRGREVSDGVYFLSISAGKVHATRKLVKLH